MSAEKKQILVIEDNTDVRENLVEILELAGYRAIEAENGKVGVQQAIRNDLDLILCDVPKPSNSGISISIKIMSKRSRWKAARACRPFSTNTV